MQIYARDGFGVAPVEAFGQAEDGRQHADRAPGLAAKVPEALVAPLWRVAAVISGDERDGLDLVRLEPAQVTVSDEVVRMLVVALVADVHADVVEQRGVLEPLAFAIGQAVGRARLLEEREREPRDLVRVIGPVVATLGQLDDAPPADVRVAVGLRDLLPMARDVVQHEAFTERQVAEREVRRAETAHDRVDQDGAGDGQIAAPRVEPGDSQPLFEVQAREQLPRAVEQLG